MSDQALAFHTYPAAATEPQIQPATVSPASSPSIAEMLGLRPIETVMRVVCEEFKITREQLVSHDRHKPLSLVRQIAIHVARRTTGASYPVLGREFGGRDHSTVMTSDRKICIRCQDDEKFKSSLEQLIRKVEGKQT